jgi:hypothetical protein
MAGGFCPGYAFPAGPFVCSEKHDSGLEKWLAKPGDGRMIAKMVRKNQFSTINDGSNVKSRLTCVTNPIKFLHHFLIS